VRKPGFTLEQLRSFLAVADTEHVSKAAASLFLTQGAVTQQLHHFERALGLRLLERDGRGVRLTDAGRNLAVSCRAALRAVEVLEETAQGMRLLESGSLHIGASPTCASYYLPGRLAVFAQLYPAVQLNVAVDTSAAISAQVLAGALDCGLIEGTPMPKLKSTVLAHDELIVVVHPDHPLARLRRVTPVQLSKYRYLGRGPTWSAEQTVRDMIGDAYDRSETMNLGHPEYVRAAALAGLGYAALPLLAVRPDLASGALARLPVPASRRAIRAVRRESSGGPTLEEFWLLLSSRPAAAAATL
jgi:DNA-binding transcriptional LysR family regulator